MSKPIACVGDRLLCPGCPQPPHTPMGYITTGSNRVFIRGRPAARVGDLGICGAPTTLVEGSAKVFIEGRPAHRIGDLNSCAGPTISSDSINCYIG